MIYITNLRVDLNIYHYNKIVFHYYSNNRHFVFTGCYLINVEICDLSYIVALLIVLEFRALPGLYLEIFITEIENFSNETANNPNPKPHYKGKTLCRKP